MTSVWIYFSLFMKRHLTLCGIILCHSSLRRSGKPWALMETRYVLGMTAVYQIRGSLRTPECCKDPILRLFRDWIWGNSNPRTQILNPTIWGSDHQDVFSVLKAWSNNTLIINSTILALESSTQEIQNFFCSWRKVMANPVSSFFVKMFWIERPVDVN